LNPYQDHKTITFVIPCYNSAEYMDHSIASLLTGSPDIEIIIVDDGSTKDDTAAKADQWQREHPDVIKVIHQENKGHGGAVMAGIRAASGVYLHVLDSDDWLDRDGLNLMLSKLRRSISSGSPVDLMITNYVNEHTTSGTRKVYRFGGALPRNRVFTWNETRSFRADETLLMHALTYRTQVLRDSGLEMPEHTYHVDHIFAYVPFPYVKTLYYLPIELYHYFIGRDDQSVNEKMQILRLDQLIRVALAMAAAYRLPEDIDNRKLATYMVKHLGIVVATTCMHAVLAGTPEALQQRHDLWQQLKAIDKRLPLRLFLNQSAVLGANFPTRFLRMLSVIGYRVVQRLYRFN